MSRRSALRIVAWLFIGSGVWAAASIAGALLIEHRINLDLDVLGLWIGPGLLRNEARYRTWALRLLVCGFCLLPVAAGLLILQSRWLDVRLFGRPVGTLSLPVALTALAGLAAVAAWQYWVLRRPDVSALFERSSINDPGRV